MADGQPQRNAAEHRQAAEGDLGCQQDQQHPGRPLPLFVSQRLHSRRTQHKERGKRAVTVQQMQGGAARVACGWFGSEDREGL